jgi:hypothetical protein
MSRFTCKGHFPPTSFFRNKNLNISYLQEFFIRLPAGNRAEVVVMKTQGFEENRFVAGMTEELNRGGRFHMGKLLWWRGKMDMGRVSEPSP